MFTITSKREVEAIEPSMGLPSLDTSSLNFDLENWLLYIRKVLENALMSKYVFLNRDVGAEIGVF